jgi:uncharacterized protein (TIGR03084 family)
MHVSDILRDLLAEQAALDTVVAGLDEADWERPTASPRWTVTDQVAHLAYFDHAAAFAINAPDRWEEKRDELLSATAADEEAVDELTLGAVRRLPVAERLTAWREARASLEAAAAHLADDARVPWYGPSMGAVSFLTARLMECWAHGQDIVDAVGATRPATDRLRHIAHLGVITRGWSYANRGLEMPAGEVHVELTAPGGELWTWGDYGAEAWVKGPAEDFCLVVTQRRHPDDVDLEVRGELAGDWLARAQAFAGPPTDGPRPGALG